jgi:hypothetical protein
VVQVAGLQVGLIPGPVEAHMFALEVRVLAEGWARITLEGDLTDADGGKIEFNEAGFSKHMAGGRGT